MAEEKWGTNERGDYTEDDMVDLRGRPVLRSKTGRWRACYFILGKLTILTHTHKN